MQYKTDLELDCMEMQKYKRYRGLGVNDNFLRKPYQYTKAEIKDDTQEKLHENDWLR